MIVCIQLNPLIDFEIERIIFQFLDNHKGFIFNIIGFPFSFYHCNIGKLVQRDLALSPLINGQYGCMPTSGRFQMIKSPQC